MEIDTARGLIKDLNVLPNRVKCLPVASRENLYEMIFIASSKNLYEKCGNVLPHYEFSSGQYRFVHELQSALAILRGKRYQRIPVNQTINPR